MYTQCSDFNNNCTVLKACQCIDPQGHNSECKYAPEGGTVWFETVDDGEEGMPIL